MPDKCMNHAGILDTNDKLTRKAKDQFIQDVINEMRYGSPSLPAVNLCGDELKPIAFAEMVDLYDEQMYPDWHATWPPQFEKMAQQMNCKGQTPFFPFCDISFLVSYVFPDIEIPGLGLPDVPPKPIVDILLPHVSFKYSPPEIALKLGQIQIPPPIDLPKIPELPTLDINLLPTLYWSLVAQYKLPTIVIDLATDFNLVLKLPNPPELLKELCKIVKKACFPPAKPDAKGVDFSNIAAQAVLARRFVQLLAIAFAACTVGSSPVGIVGGLGAQFGYREPPGDAPQEDKAPKSTAEKIITSASEGVGLHSSRNSVHDSIRHAYAAFLFPDSADAPKRDAWVYEKTFSSCACFMRTVYRRACGGSVGDKDVDAPYSTRPPGVVIDDLMRLAKKRGAIKYEPKDMKSTNLMNVNIKPGDGIIVSSPSQSEGDIAKVNDLKTHVLIVGEELPHIPAGEHMSDRNRTFVSYEGGAPNIEPNGSKKDDQKNILVGGQRIKKGTYVFTQPALGANPITAQSGKLIYWILDGEKMVSG